MKMYRDLCIKWVFVFFCLLGYESCCADEKPFVVELYADGATQEELTTQTLHLMEKVEKNRMRKGVAEKILRDKVKDPNLTWTSSSSIVYAGPYRLGLISVKALYPTGIPTLKYLTVVGVKKDTEYRIICSVVGEKLLDPLYGKCANKIKEIFGCGVGE